MRLIPKGELHRKEWLLFFQDTNPLPFRSLCAVLGVSAKNGFVMNSVAVPRIPGEAQSRKTYTYIYPSMKKLGSHFDFWRRFPVLFCNYICGGRLPFN